MNTKRTLNKLTRTLVPVELHDYDANDPTLWANGLLFTVPGKMDTYIVGTQEFKIDEVVLIKSRLTETGEVWQVVVSSQKIVARELTEVGRTATLTVLNYNKRNDGPIRVIERMNEREGRTIVEAANDSGGYQLVLTDTETGKVLVKRYSSKSYAKEWIDY